MKNATLIRVSLYMLYYFINIFIYPQLEIFLLTLPLFLIILLGLIRINNNQFSFLDLFWFVSYIMFVIRPIQMVDFQNKIFVDGPTGGYKFLGEDFYIVSFCLFLFYFTVFLLVYKTKQYNYSNNNFRINNTFKEIIILTILFLAIYSIYIYLSGGLSNILLPRSEKIRDDITKGAFALFAFLNVLYFFLLYIYFNGEEKKLYTLPFIIIVSLMMFIISNPFNTARFFLMATWTPVIFLYFRNYFPILLSYLSIFFVLIVIFPILSITTRFGFSKINNIDFSTLIDVAFKLQFIDTYDMMVYLVHRITQLGFNYGESLIGMLFFFIPRSLWESKPDSLALKLGDELVAKRIAGTPNLSMFYGAELYADFWYFGIIFAGLVTGFILRYIISLQFNNTYEKILVLIILSSFPIIIRGPFNGVIGLIFFQILSFYLIKFLLKKGII